MATFKLTVETDNAAFDTSNHEELARIILNTSRRVFNEGRAVSFSFPVQDSNGNSVGRAELLST